MGRCKCLREVLSGQVQSALEVRQALEDVRSELKDVKALLTGRGKGGLMVGLGLACLAFPEPLFSNIVGATLIALGRVFQRSNSSLKDLVRAFKEIKSSLELMNVDW